MSSRNVKDLLVGTLIGIVSMLPGASGATIAVIFGVYERLIADLADIKNKLFKDLRFIIPMGIGIMLGLFVCAVGLDWMIDNYEVPMMFFFAALILMQVPDIMKLGDDGQPRSNMNNLALVCGVGVMFCIFAIGFIKGGDFAGDGSIGSMIMMFVAGVVLAMSKLAPGISGSTILLALGLFNPLMDAISDVDLTYLAPIGLGMLAGLFVSAKILDGFMRNHRKSTYSAILGLTLGSVCTVTLEAIMDVTGTDDMLGGGAGIILGLIIGYGLARIASAYAEKTLSETT
jgi:putative membrane protein